MTQNLTHDFQQFLLLDRVKRALDVNGGEIKRPPEQVSLHNKEEIKQKLTMKQIRARRR